MTTWPLISAILTTVNSWLTCHWLTYMTSWNYVSVTLYFVFACVTTLSYLNKQSRNDDTRPLILSSKNEPNQSDIQPNDKLPWYIEQYWISHNIALNLCTLVSVMFWSLVYWQEEFPGPDLRQYLLVDRHGVILIFLIFDFWLCKIPIHFLHFLYVEIFAIIYLVFSVIYWEITGKVMYKVLDYTRQPGIAAGIWVVSVLCIPICQ